MAEHFNNSVKAMEFDHIRTVAYNITEGHPQTQVGEGYSAVYSLKC